MPQQGCQKWTCSLTDLVCTTNKLPPCFFVSGILFPSDKYPQIFFVLNNWNDIVTPPLQCLNLSPCLLLSLSFALQQHPPPPPPPPHFSLDSKPNHNSITCIYFALLSVAVFVHRDRCVKKNTNKSLLVLTFLSLHNKVLSLSVCHCLSLSVCLSVCLSLCVLWNAHQTSVVRFFLPSWQLLFITSLFLSFLTFFFLFYFSCLVPALPPSLSFFTQSSVYIYI